MGLDTYGLAVFADGHPETKEFSKRYPAITRVLEGSGHQTQPCVLADLAMRLELFGDEAISRATSGCNGLDLVRLLADGGTLVIDTPEAHAQQLLPLTGLLISQILATIIDEAGKSASGRLDPPCTLILDEFGSACGRLPEFETRLATLRSRGVSVLAAVQTVSQLDNLYGRAAEAVLENFGSKLFLGGALSLADAKRASDMSGQCTVASDSVTVTREFDAGWSKRVTRTRTPVARPVLLPDEIGRPPVNPILGPPATVFLPGRPPFYAYFPPAYESPPLATALGGGSRPDRHQKGL